MRRMQHSKNADIDSAGNWEYGKFDGFCSLVGCKIRWRLRSYVAESIKIELKYCFNILNDRANRLERAVESRRFRSAPDFSRLDIRRVPKPHGFLN